MNSVYCAKYSRDVLPTSLRRALHMYIHIHRSVHIVLLSEAAPIFSDRHTGTHALIQTPDTGAFGRPQIRAPLQVQVDGLSGGAVVLFALLWLNCVC